MKYLVEKYFYPPRPQNAVPTEQLEFYSRDKYMSQPKLDGSNCSIYTNGKKVRFYNRHNQLLTGVRLDEREIIDIYEKMNNKGWLVLNGEYLNKNKKGTNDRSFNHELVLFDLLVFNGEHLIGSTFQERYDLLKDELEWVQHPKEGLLWTLGERIHLVHSINGGAKQIWDKIQGIEVYEGILNKRANARLEMGNSEKNNHKTQVKTRKPTKNYQY